MSETILSVLQVARAYLFYSEHREHVEGMMKFCKRAYPPTEREDKEDPRIWKAEHWCWFFDPLGKKFSL